ARDCAAGFQLRAVSYANARLNAALSVENPLVYAECERSDGRGIGNGPCASFIDHHASYRHEDCAGCERHVVSDERGAGAAGERSAAERESADVLGGGADIERRSAIHSYRARRRKSVIDAELKDSAVDRRATAVSVVAAKYLNRGTGFNHAP